MSITQAGKGPKVPKHHFVDSMERTLEHHHKIVLFSLYCAILVFLLGAFAYAGSRLRTRATPTGNVTLSTPYATYLVGESISFTVTNNYNATIAFDNKCPQEPLAVYRQESGKWVRVHDRTDASTCKNQKDDVFVLSHKTVSGNFDGFKNLFATPGTYRIAAYIEYFNTVAVRDIKILAKPAVPTIPALLPPKTTTTASTRTSTSSTASTGGTTSTTSSNTTTTTTPTTPVTPPPPPTQSKTITLSVGTINATYSSTTIYLGTVTPKAGCWYEKNRSSGSTIEVTFKCSGNETQVNLRLSGGNLTYRVED